MNKNFVCFVLLVVFILVSIPLSALLVTIGTGTTYNGPTTLPTPYGTYYANFRQQYMYRASEITAAGGSAGYITIIGFNVQALNNCGNMTNFRIRMKHTEQANLIETFEAGSYTQVWYQSLYRPLTIGWTTHTLTTPFYWDGTSNLLIDILTDIDGIARTQNASVYYTATLMRTTSLRFQSNTLPASSATTGATSSYRANLRMVLMSPPLPASLNSPGLGADAFCNVKLWWIPGEGAPPTGYILYLGTDGGGTTAPTNLVNGLDLGNVTTYTHTSYLPVNSTYYWMIVPYNNGLEAVECPIWSFNTVPLSGTLYIGSAGDFTTFTSSISLLNHSGTTGTGVTFKVANGIYNETPPAVTVSGTSTGRIIFEPAGDEDEPVLTITEPTQTYGFKIDNAAYITFNNIDVSGPNTVLYGYWLANGVFYVTIENCTINIPYNGIQQNSAIYSYGFSSSCTFRYNTINNTTYYAINLRGISGDYNYNSLILGNQITNATSCPIYLTYAENCTVSENDITITPGSTYSINGIVSAYPTEDLSIHHNTFSGTTTHELHGIYLQSESSAVYSNTLVNLHNTGSGEVMGIFSDGSNNRIFSNTVGNLSYTGTGSYQVSGIRCSNGYNTNVFNNMIYGLSNPNSSVDPQIYGIRTTSGMNTNVLHNTIFLNASGAASNFSVHGVVIYNYLASALLVNNIVVNLSTPGSNGIVTALYCQNGTPDVISSNSDHNIYYCGVPDASHLFAKFGTLVYPTLADFQATSIAEQNSYTELVPFISMTDPINVHLSMNVPTVAEGNALHNSTIMTDIDGDPRNPTTPDIGADEGDFMPIPVAPEPAVLVSPVSGANAFCNVSLNWSPGSGNTTGNKLYLGTDGGGTTAPTNLVNGLDLGNVTSYTHSFFLPVSFTLYWMIVPYNNGLEAVGCPIWSFNTVPLSGTLEIGPSGDFLSITSAISLLNHSGVAGTGVTFKVADGTYNETPPAITVSGTELGRIVFESATTADNPVLSIAAGASMFGFKLEGGDYITFDNIDVVGFNTLQYGYWLTDGATHNRIQSCNILIPYNSGAPNFAIYSYGVNDYGEFIGNNIESDTYYGIIVTGFEGNLSNYNIIQGNNIINSRRYAIQLDYAIHSIVSGNSISIISGSSNSFTGIWAKGTCDDTQVFNNTIHGTTTGSIYAIFLQSGNTLVHHNIMTDLHSTVTGGITGIWAQGGFAYVYANLISNLSYTGTQAYRVMGLYLGGESNRAYNNMISGLSNPNGTTTPQIYGMMLYSWANSFIFNNTVYLNAEGSVADFSTAGMFIGPDASVKLQGNIIVNLSTPGTTGFTSALYSPTGTTAILQFGTDKNIYYCGTPDASHLIGKFDVNSYPTLAEYQAAAGSKDQGSFTELVPFVSMADPIDLHIRTDQMTNAESNAIPQTWLTTDFDDDLRNAITPDIGADEGEFNTGAIGIPQNLHIVNLDGVYYLQWDAVTGATTYKVYKSDDAYAPLPWNLITSIPAGETEYILPLADSKAFYYITAE